MTVMQALSTAGGFAESAGPQKYSDREEGGGKGDPSALQLQGVHVGRKLTAEHPPQSRRHHCGAISDQKK